MVLTILGNSSATPTKDRFPSAQILNIQSQLFLIDCGEGTQMRLKYLGIRFLKIDHIFISHLHGDHFFGLIGLISTMHLLGRKKLLNIYAAPQLKEIIEIQLKYSNTVLNFEINFVELKENCVCRVLETKTVEVYSFPLKHRIPTWGFKFNQKEKPLNVKPEIILKYDLSIEQIKAAKNGFDIELQNKVLENDKITFGRISPMSYAYCSDTIYDPSIVEYIKDVKVLYHESTFLNELEEIAKDKYHSTAEEAAKIANFANVKLLIIGHFSARYKDLGVFLEEAQSVFQRTILSECDSKYNLNELV